VFRIHIYFNADLDSAFSVNADPDADAVQGFHDQNLEKFTNEKKNHGF
jgi:hypothetical protein